MSLLAIIDLIWGAYILQAQIRRIIKKRKLDISNLAFMMFSFVYGFFPAFVLFRQVIGNSAISMDTSSNGIFYLAAMTFCSFFSYLSMNISYLCAKPSKHLIPVIEDQTAVKSAIIMLLIGYVSLFLWTRADGGILNFISHADGIRAGYYQIQNSFAFLEHVTKILIFAGSLLLSYWIQTRLNSFSKVAFFFPAILSVLGAFLFVSAWDSRAMFGFFVLIIILAQIDYRVIAKKKMVKSEVVKLVTALGLSFFIMYFSETIMNLFRGIHSTSASGMNAFSIVEKEFAFLIRTGQTVVKNITSTDFHFQIGNDLLNAATAWIPERILPFKLPDTLWTYNTLLVAGTTIHGINPSDIVASSLYELWIPGVIIIPLIYGFFLKKIETSFINNRYLLYNSVLKAIIATVVINSISHFSLSSIVESSFYILLGYVITLFCNARKKSMGGKRK